MQKTIAAVLMLFAASLLSGAETYQKPVPELARLVDAPLIPLVSVSPDESTLLLMNRPTLPPIDELAAPELRLAGLRINPRISGPSRAVGFNGLRFVDVTSGKERAVSGLPASPRIRNATWSPDGRHVAFTNDRESSIELWLISRETASARRLGDVNVNQVLGGRALFWIDSATLLTRVVPADRAAAPVDRGVPEGPVIQESIGRTAPAR